MGYSIEELSESNIHQWEEFNNRSPEGTLFHSIRWKNILEETRKLQLRYYLIFEGQRVVGICPFVEQSMKKLFRGLNGIPRSDYNNIILDGIIDPDHINEILSLFSKRYSYLFFDTYDPALPERIEYDNI
ncbi:MAG: hypothetical protein CVV34_00155, partial [Methanomicrobiales archaeon HGW-Methanomicrobiales-5]